MNGLMNCNRNDVREWENFKFLGKPNKFKLQNSNGKYCSSKNSKKPMICNRDSTSLWEKFSWISVMEHSQSDAATDAIFPVRMVTDR